MVVTFISDGSFSWLVPNSTNMAHRDAEGSGPSTHDTAHLVVLGVFNGLSGDGWGVDFRHGGLNRVGTLNWRGVAV